LIGVLLGFDDSVKVPFAVNVWYVYPPDVETVPPDAVIPPSETIDADPVPM
jgi:hypothetical protein